MTEIPFDLNEKTIASFFEQGECLTFDPLEPTEAFKFAAELKKAARNGNPATRTVILSKTARFRPDNGYTPPFHYFSDGTLLHRFYSKNDKKQGLERIKEFLRLHGCKVTRTYGPRDIIDREYDFFLRDISAFARRKHPYANDLYATALPDKETFVKQCFENKSVLLSACKAENIDPKYRDILALFSDGRFFVSEEYENRIGINDPLAIYDFNLTYKPKHFVVLKREYVPQSYLTALYRKAADYDWYLPPQEALRQQTGRYQPTAEELREMNDFINDLLPGRTCVSVTIPDPSDEFISPERENFVLFSDGTLILDSHKKGVEDIFCSHFRRPFPEMTFNIRFVPDFYVPEIYKRLLEKQKSARQIYLEMLKQKSKKLKKKLNIPHHEALELVAVMAGWPNWKAATVIEEKQARHVICTEHVKKKIADRQGLDPIEWEYQEFLQKKQSEQKK